MPASKSSKAKKTARSAAKSTSSRSRKCLPKAAPLKVKIDPVEHSKATREMVLEDRAKLGQFETQVEADRVDSLKRIGKLEKSRVGAGMMFWGTEIVLCGGVVYLLLAKFGVLP